MNKQYDAIVVGAGHNGLVAAAYLAKAGLRVLVLEQRPVLGGAAATEEIFPGFKFNTGSADAGLFRPAIVKDLALDRHGLSFLEGEAAVFAPQPDGTALTLWREPQRSAAEIARFSAADAEKYPAFLERVSHLAAVLRETLALTPPDLAHFSPATLMPWLGVGLKLRRLGEQEMMELLRVLPMPVRDFLDEWFESEALKGALGVLGIAGGLPGPQAAGTTLMFLYQQLGAPNSGFLSSRLVRGGTGALSAALAAAAQQHGAEICPGTAVAHILLDDLAEGVKGVRLANGQEISARFVVSSADPRRTFCQLVGAAHLEPQLLRAVRNIRYQGMTAKVNLALNGLPTFSGATSPGQLTGHIVVAPDLEYLERAWDDAKYGRVSQRPVLDVVIPSLLDSSLAPAGQHVMSITVQYAPYHLRESHWDAERERLGDQVVATLATYAPDLPERILHCQVITPLDWEREYGLTEGHIYHGQMGLDQMFFMRPAAGQAQYRTPFKGLYLCGAGAHPGGGVSGAPGRNAAREILRDGR
ncbi:MAG: NAD(P)/FAD-dependent oxidoreductase [Chloroflexi bacterium]|nr:NAD(P)/FAD-dependent oxidoreductase [Chloroflexota bacterium]MCI0580629.1 NAD(P)/FAD-dependent oxidoreductase [Chloroflexota bacterium]MCI0647641.1 NAD(P)/FAD-dependent oxidoreductase [Chloroflexota bacterium]MCI0731143.1 NAD(P)/FAD-dependent oxidoreductase [Chloroflexota bacterium]